MWVMLTRGVVKVQMLIDAVYVCCWWCNLEGNSTDGPEQLLYLLERFFTSCRDLFVKDFTQGNIPNPCRTI